MKNTHAFLFDMDGTLSDTEVLWVAVVEVYLSDQGFPVEHAWALQTVCGRAWSSIYRDIVERFPQLACKTSSEMAEETYPYFDRMKRDCDIRIQGSVALLKALAAEGYPCCVVSGSPRAAIEEVTGILGISEDLQFYLGSEDVHCGKPSPEGYLRAAERLGIPPGNCVVFEDSSAGVAAGRAAGMGTVALVLADHPPQDVSAAHLRLSDLRDFDLARLKAAMAAKDSER